MNIIMIMCDSLRQDHLGCYGNDWIETPNIDKLAGDCVVFENAYPEGLPTLPVRTALFTGNYTLTNRFWQELTPQDVTMAEILDELDYKSAMITDTFHLFKPNMNYHRGFHNFRWIRGQSIDAYEVRPHGKDLTKYISPKMEGAWTIRILDQYLRNIAGRDPDDEEQYFAALVRRESVQWLKYAHDSCQPFFLYVDFFDPHEPWDPPPAFASKYVDPDYRGPRIINPKIGPCDWMTEAELKNCRALYAAEVSFLDKQIGILLDHIESLGLLDDSVLILLADHGIPLGEHGSILKGVDQLYGEILRIPFMIRFPGKEHAGKRIKAIVEVVDVLPTLLHVIGCGNEAEYMHGKNLLPLITGQCEKIHDYAICGFFSTDQRCIRNETWSYIRRAAEGKTDELYNLIEDPKEKTNLIDQYPDTAKEMYEALPKIFNIRLQKEHHYQMKWDVPGLVEGRFPPLRLWKK
ncbi:MAG: sulfatase [Deltaproteobacteria bacterium]|nr:sulfatase [Deltaproteobacteria bacterium]MBW2151201.1 sulfatase [Deltaproteobacteria bacterium]